MLNKTVMAASVALALGMTSSAFAAARSFDDAEYGFSAPTGYGEIYAQASRAGVMHQRTNSSPPVVVEGQVIGRDPDLTIRNQVERDYLYLND